MVCADAEPLLGACLDGEVDAKTALEVDEHLTTCMNCFCLYGKLEHLRREIALAGLDLSAGVDLQPLRAVIRRKNRPAWPRRIWASASLVATAAAVLLFVSIPKDGGIDRQIVDNHIRSLMAEHLIDVPSSDRHTVKPWFQGKLGFAPTVPDLSGDGFVLVGGRLDVISGRQTAAIVYRRQNHVINLWIATSGEGRARPQSAELDGYHLLAWQQNAMSYWAVSDLNVAELQTFKDLILSR